MSAMRKPVSVTQNASSVDVDASRVAAPQSAVRRKLGPYGDYLVTVRGVGYKFAEHPQEARQ